MAPKNDMMKLMSMKQGESKSLRELVKRYHRVVLDFRTFNHPQALRGLKERVKIRRMWYNLRNPTVQTYSVAYEQVKGDIEIEKEKVARIKSEQLRS